MHRRCHIAKVQVHAFGKISLRQALGDLMQHVKPIPDGAYEREECGTVKSMGGLETMMNSVLGLTISRHKAWKILFPNVWEEGRRDLLLGVQV